MENKIVDKMKKELLVFVEKFNASENLNVNADLHKYIEKNIKLLAKTNFILIDSYIDMIEQELFIKRTVIKKIKKNVIDNIKERKRLQKKSDKIKTKESKNEEKQIQKKKKFDNSFSSGFKGEYGEFDDFNDLTIKIIENYPIYYDNSLDLWWIWDFDLFKWNHSNKEQVFKLIDYCVEDNNLMIKSVFRNEIFNSLKMRAADKEIVPIKPDKNWIQFKNKIVDIKTLETYDSSPKYFITNIIPWALGKDEKTPIMDGLFKDWVVKEGVQDESYVKTLYQITAYAMLSHGPLQKIIALTGSGANGKSTYVKLLRKLFEKEEHTGDNVASTSIYDLTTNKFGTSALYKKLLGLISEVNSHEMRFTNLLKSLSGEDLIRFEFKGKDEFTDVNTCTVLITANTLPKTNDTTDGYYRRWELVDFPNKFKGKKEVLIKIPDKEFQNLCFKSIKILNELLKEGKFENEGDLTEQIRKYESKSSPINMFIQECCEYDTSEKMSIEDLLYWINWFFKRNKIGKIKVHELINFLRKEGFFFIKNSIKGLKLKETNDIIREQFKRETLLTDEIKEKKNQEERKKYFKNIDRLVSKGELQKVDGEQRKHDFDEEKRLTELYKDF